MKTAPVNQELKNKVISQFKNGFNLTEIIKNIKQNYPDNEKSTPFLHINTKNHYSGIGHNIIDIEVSGHIVFENEDGEKDLKKVYFGLPYDISKDENNQPDNFYIHYNLCIINGEDDTIKLFNLYNKILYKEDFITN